MIQRHDDERMADFFVGDELRDFRHRHEPRFQIFAVIKFHARAAAGSFQSAR